MGAYMHTGSPRGPDFQWKLANYALPGLGRITLPRGENAGPRRYPMIPVAIDITALSSTYHDSQTALSLPAGGACSFAVAP